MLRFSLCLLLALAIPLAALAQEKAPAAPPEKAATDVVEIQIVIAEWRRSLDGKEASVAALEDIDLRDTQALEKLPGLTVLQRVQLSTLAGRESHAQFGERRPFVTATSQSGRGGITRSASFHNTGTQVRVTPHVDQQRIRLDLNVESSGVNTGHFVPAGDREGDDESSPFGGVDYFNIAVTLLLKDDQTRLVASSTSREGEQAHGTVARKVVLVSARLAP